MKDHNFKRRQFNLQIKMPFMWHLKAETLFKSYKLLSKEAESFHREYKRKFGLVDTSLNPLATSLMLAGFAFENLLKGKMIKDNEDCINSSGKFRHDSHKLNVLADRAGIELNADERELFDMLTSYIRYAGRYPVPLAADEMFPTKDTGGDTFRPLMSHYFNADGTCQTFPKSMIYTKR